MFKWLCSFFGKFRRPGEESYDFYDLGERLIYRYHNGTKVIHADPMVLHRRMMGYGAELDVDIKVANSMSKDAGKAYVELQRKIRSIFDVKPYEEGGLTEQETVTLLDHFLIYCEHVKKKANPSPTVQTETLPGSSSSTAAVPPIESSSDSGSIASESSIAVPTPSPSESGSGSDSSTQEWITTSP